MICQGRLCGSKELRDTSCIKNIRLGDFLFILLLLLYTSVICGCWKVYRALCRSYCQILWYLILLHNMRNVIWMLLEKLYSFEHIIPAVFVIYEPLDNVLVLDLHIDGLIQHSFHVVDLFLLNFGKVYGLNS